MIGFLLTFLLIYGSMNAYAWWRLTRGWQAFESHRWLALALFAVMTLGPIWARLIDGAGSIWLARPAAWLAYLWMAWGFWVLMAGVPLDLWNLALRGVARLRPEAASLLLSPQRALMVIAVVVAAGTVWGFVEAQLIRTTRLDLQTAALPPDSEPLTILYFSDSHFGPYTGRRRFDLLRRRVRELQPDLLLCAGDMLDGHSGHEGMEADLAALHAPLGKFTVLGNHEVYTGIDYSMQMLENAGFTVLRGDWQAVGDHLVVAGVDDPAAGMRGGRWHDEVALPAAGDRYVILLKHQAEVASAAGRRPDLQLSGHGHRGQIFPFGVFVYLRYGNLYGFHPGAPALYVSSGYGTWGPPLRVLAPPELVLITLSPEDHR